MATTQDAATAIGGVGFFHAGLLGLDLDDLNASLAGAGLPGLDASVPTWGGGGYGPIGRFLMLLLRASRTG